MRPSIRSFNHQRLRPRANYAGNSRVVRQGPCQYEGGPLAIWNFTDIALQKAWTKDNNNDWSPDLKVYEAPFFIVPGNVNQTFNP
jgi:hypothetical protein